MIIFIIIIIIMGREDGKWSWGGKMKREGREMGRKDGEGK